METPITDAMFSAFLRCETKAHLLARAASAGNCSNSQVTQQTYALDFNLHAAQLLKSTVQENEYCSGTPSLPAIKAGQFKVIFNPLLKSRKLSAQPDVILRTPHSDTLPAYYFPVRFLARNKPLIDDKLLLAFDATALSRVTGSLPQSGKLICGTQFATTTVPLAKLLKRVQLILPNIARLSTQQSAPDLVLNKHCQECEFQQRCRKLAVELDDLSLLSNLTSKERKKYNNKGIFTVTQLSYTYRPRKRRRSTSSRPRKHDHALKALAIRKGCIHVVGTSTIELSGNCIYLDVEGVPDRNFYYLVGLRYKLDDKYVQHSFWADTLSEERGMWKSFLHALGRFDEPRLVHYGSYETQFLKRMRERYSNDEREEAYIDRLITRSCNLLSFTYAHVYFPTYSNSLKEIARYLGFDWSEKDASGLKTLYWRSEWELTGDAALKQQLLTYNSEDCEAVQKLAEMLSNLCAGQVSGPPQTLTVNVDDLESDRPFRFGPLQYALPAFKAINEAAYWDYQRSRIYVRTNKHLKSVSQREGHQSGRPPPISKFIQAEEHRPDHCPKCGSGRLYINGKYSHTVFDLYFSSTGVRRSVVKYYFKRYQCWTCKCGYNELPRQEMYGKGLKAFVLHQVIELRVSQHAVGRTVGALFGFPLSPTSINCIKRSATKYYDTTYKHVLQRIVTGQLVHADETRILIKGETRYVWVFTNLEDVAYVYSENRDGATARDLLKDFSGVLVSDFYAGYDSISCAQQKCLIHLLRDINEDTLKEPFNREMETLARNFAEILQPIIHTIDRFGLKAYHLRAHKSAVERFYRNLSKQEYASEIAAGYKKRFEKNRQRLFTFLDHDGVPWNNNNAEHAIKAFARLRNVIGATGTPNGLKEYLVLLSISESCKYKGVSFLEFLKSGELNIDAFVSTKGKR